MVSLLKRISDRAATNNLSAKYRDVQSEATARKPGGVVQELETEANKWLARVTTSCSNWGGLDDDIDNLVMHACFFVLEKSPDLHDFANTAEGFIVRQSDIVSMTKGSRLWGPNTIVNLVFNHNDASANVWLTHWAIQTEPGLVPRMTIVVAGPKGRIKTIAESLGKTL